MSNIKKIILAVALISLFFVLTIISVILFNMMVETGLFYVIRDLLSTISLTQKVVIVIVPILAGSVAALLLIKDP